MKALIFEAGSGKISEEEIPADMLDEVESFKETLIEAAAEANDDLLGKYWREKNSAGAKIMDGIKEAASNGSAVFVFCGSALNNMGVSPLMDFIVNCGTAPDKNPLVAGKDMENEAFLAQVFKTIADRYFGRMSMFRVSTVKLKSGPASIHAQ